MVNQSLVVLGAGALAELPMRRATQVLADGLSLPLQTVAAGQRADGVLEALPVSAPSVIRLSGDPGRMSSDGRSWLEALGAWRMPVLMLGAPLADGAMPGAVPAFCALCHQHRVPLLGLIQMGGLWNPVERRRDGLPWLGWLADADQLTAESQQQRDVVMALVAQRLAGFSSTAKAEMAHQV